MRILVIYDMPIYRTIKRAGLNSGWTGSECDDTISHTYAHIKSNSQVRVFCESGISSPVKVETIHTDLVALSEMKVDREKGHIFRPSLRSLLLPVS